MLTVIQKIFFELKWWLGIGWRLEAVEPLDDVPQVASEHYRFETWRHVATGQTREILAAY